VFLSGKNAGATVDDMISHLSNIAPSSSTEQVRHILPNRKPACVYMYARNLYVCRCIFMPISRPVAVQSNYCHLQSNLGSVACFSTVFQ
jgi:hypothetical protein